MITFEQIAKLPVIPEIFLQGTDIPELLHLLNERVKNTGVEFGESEFSYLLRGAEIPPFEDFRWITCWATRGHNEGFYVYLQMVPQNHLNAPSIIFASAKTWDWESAQAIAAIVTRIISWF